MPRNTWPKLEKPEFSFLPPTAPHPNSEHARNALSCAKTLAPTADFIGSFNCQGEVNLKVLETASAKNPRPAWIDDAAMAAGHPDDSDLERLQTDIAALPQV